MKPTWLVVALIAALCCLLAGCGPAGSLETEEAPTSALTDAVGLPNSASVYCQEQGYKHEIRTAADGSQSGVCIFPDGSECDEWAFYEGECGPSSAAAAAAGLPNPAAAYCQERGYSYEIRTAADGSQSGVCIFADGSECDEWVFYRGECGPENDG
jgi:putative hemolysin